MKAVIRTEGLTKYYGKAMGIEDMNLEVPGGVVFGFLGPNGAGKTTTMRILMDLLRPTEGRAEVLGLDTRKNSIEIRDRVGYLPGELALYDRLTAQEMFRFFADLRAVRDLGWAPELAERLDLDVGRPIRDLSKGNKQKVGVILALMHRPELLILDEPTSGLDPLAQREFADILHSVTNAGATVLLSSHGLDEVERLADQVAIIRGGLVVTTEKVGNLKASALTKLELTFGESVPSELFEDIPGVRDAEVDGNHLTCTVVGSVDGLLKKATRFEVVAIKSTEVDLEEVFMQYFGEASDAT